MMVSFVKDDKVGFINYNHVTKDLVVEFQDAVVKNRIVKYLNTEREFFRPESQVLDDYRQDMKKPVENLMYMELALCEIYVRHDIWIDWETLTGGTDEVDPPEVKST